MSNSLFKDKTREEILKSLQIHDKNTEVATVLQNLRELIEQEHTDKVSKISTFRQKHLFQMRKY